ncbi:MAG: hypothetical protein HY077_02800 [Elusimicrobia bacterium]|nr:hypothetical protein [Elusimicrobiota bacterium]
MLSLLLTLALGVARAETAAFDALYLQGGEGFLRAAREVPVAPRAAPPPAPRRYKAQGVVAGERVTTTVDSEGAALYLQGRLSEAPEFKEKLDSYRAAASGLAPHELGPLLRESARKLSPDAASLLFAELVAESEQGRRWRGGYEQALAQWKSAGGRLPASAQSIVVLAVPAFLYKSHPESGAGLEKVIEAARAIGLRAERLEVGENSKVEDNARAIADEIRRRGAAGERLVLVSGSKSGAEVAEALGRYLRPEEAAPVLAWVNGAGTLRGSPLADMVKSGPARLLVGLRMRMEGFGLRGIDSLRTKTRRASFASLSFPPSIRIVNLVAVPMSGDIYSGNRSNYESLNEFGPNDGVTLLTDAIVPGAITLLKPGVDHYMAAKVDADALGALISGCLEASPPP